MAVAERRRGGNRSRARRRRIAAAVVVVAVIVVAVLLRALTVQVPLVRTQALVGSTVRLSGPAPRVAWPSEGQAAVEVEGLGSLGTFGSATPAPIASVAKIMTAYLTLQQNPLRNGDDGFMMTVTHADVADWRHRLALGESVVPVRVGEQLSERDALEALMLPSANNVTTMLAEHASGGMDGFVSDMNAAAGRLGMRSTTYTDPSGFNATTVSTAADQVLLARAAMRIPTFAQIAALPSAVIPVAGEVTNFNGLVGHDGYVGIKTGSDSAAGGCLVFAKRIVVAGRHLEVVGAVMGQRDGSLIPAALDAGEQLGDSAAAAVKLRTAIPRGGRVLTATGTDAHSVNVVAGRALREIGWGGMTVPVRVSSAPPTRSLVSGQRVATVHATGLTSPTISAVAAKPLSKPSFGWRLRHVF